MAPGDRERVERGVVAPHFTEARSTWFGLRSAVRATQRLSSTRRVGTYDMLRCGVHKEDLWQHQPAAGAHPAAGGHVESV